MASVIANELKVGNVIDYKGCLWKITSLQHVKPGKGGAFMQAEMKNVKTGSKSNERFRSQEAVEKVVCESIPATFLFGDENSIDVITSDSFEQLSLPRDLAGHSGQFLYGNIDVVLQKIGDEIISISLPDSVSLTVIETQPKMKAQTVTATVKPATLENGVIVSVPQFIVEGDKIRVKTEDGSYVEKVE